MSGFLALWGPLIIIGFLIIVFWGDDEEQGIEQGALDPGSDASTQASTLESPSMDLAGVESTTEMPAPAMPPVKDDPVESPVSAGSLTSVNQELAIALEASDEGRLSSGSAAEDLAAAFKDAGLSVPKAAPSGPEPASGPVLPVQPVPAMVANPAPQTEYVPAGPAPPPAPPAPLFGAVHEQARAAAVQPLPPAYPPIPGPFQNPWSPVDPQPDQGLAASGNAWAPPAPGYPAPGGRRPAAGFSPFAWNAPGAAPPPAAAPQGALGPWSAQSLVPCPPPYYWCMAPRQAGGGYSQQAW